MQTNPGEYKKAINWLFKQFPAYFKVGEKAYKPTLDNTLKLISHFNLDLSKLKFIHIAGTNGKGSTSNFLASTLQEAGIKTGLFTSPHIKDFRERIRVDGRMISEEEVVNFCNEIKTRQFSVKPSFFELTWVLALKHFIENKCDLVVVETGLGGRLDATNVITPLLSVITNISLEHTQILGNTLAEIAIEKAGIIKPGIPVIVGRRQKETEDVFSTEALRNHTFILYSDEKEISKEISELQPLPYQQSNLKLVSEIIEFLNSQNFSISDDHFVRGVKNVSRNTGFYGRFQYDAVDNRIIYDVSHNEEGISETLNYLKSFGKKVHVIYGSSSDKDLQAIFRHFPKEFRYSFTSFPGERSSSIEDLKKLSDEFQLKADFYNAPKEALEIAKSTVGKEDIIIILGSFFLVAEYF